MAISPASRERVHFGGGGDRQRETFPSCHSKKKKEKKTKNSQRFNPTADSFVSHVHVQLKQAQTEAELEPLCAQTFSRPYRDLSSQWFYVPKEIYFSSFIEALVHVSITCFCCLTHPDGTNEPNCGLSQFPTWSWAWACHVPLHRCCSLVAASWDLVPAGWCEPVDLIFSYLHFHSQTQTQAESPFIQQADYCTFVRSAIKTCSVMGGNSCVRNK